MPSSLAVRGLDFESDYEGISGNVVGIGKLQESVAMLTAIYRRIQARLRGSRDYERESSKSRSKDRKRGRDKDKDRERDKDKDREKSRDRDRERERDKDRDRHRDHYTVSGKEVREGKEEDIEMMMITTEVVIMTEGEIMTEIEMIDVADTGLVLAQEPNLNIDQGHGLVHGPKVKNKRVSGFDMAPPASAILDGAAAVTAVWKVCTKMHGVILVSKFSSFKELQCHHSPNPSQLLKEGDNSMVDILKLAVISPFYIPLQEHL
ncbi:hypothetical protein L1887_39370 [Cichorium endivia]|nr:hypothetical protein L1887_39370 [Cichorium endivia]